MKAVKAQHRPSLLVMSGKEIGHRAAVEQSVLVGRDPDCDLVLTDAMVSWHHCSIEDREDAFALVDLGSTNGTALNGKKVAEEPLSPNDKIVLGGRIVVRFEIQDGLEQAYS